MVEWDGLENRCTGNRTVGSNPTSPPRSKLLILFAFVVSALPILFAFSGACRQALSDRVARESFIRNRRLSRGLVSYCGFGSTTVSCPTPHFLASGRDAKPETRLNRELLMRFKSRAVRAVPPVEGQTGIVHQPVRGELWWMSAVQDRRDNVGGEEGESRRDAKRRNRLPPPLRRSLSRLGWCPQARARVWLGRGREDVPGRDRRSPARVTIDHHSHLYSRSPQPRAYSQDFRCRPRSRPSE